MRKSGYKLNYITLKSRHPDLVRNENKSECLNISYPHRRITDTVFSRFHTSCEPKQVSIPGF